MSEEDLIHEVEEDIERAAEYEQQLPEGIQKGSGEEEYHHLLEIDQEFAIFLERFPAIVEEFGTLAMSEVLKGKMRQHPDHLRLLENFFIFYKQNHHLIEKIAEDLWEERKKRDAQKNTR